MKQYVRPPVRIVALLLAPPARPSCFLRVPFAARNPQPAKSRAGGFTAVAAPTARLRLTICPPPPFCRTLVPPPSSGTSRRQGLRCARSGYFFNPSPGDYAPALPLVGVRAPTRRQPRARRLGLEVCWLHLVSHCCRL